MTDGLHDKFNRIKFTGYLEIAALDPEDLDSDDATGLSESGYAKYTGMDCSISISDLEDIEVELSE